METIQQQLNSLQTSVKRQRLLNIALLGVIVAGGFIAAVRYDSTPQQSSGDKIIKWETTTVVADKLQRDIIVADKERIIPQNWLISCKELVLVDDAGRQYIKMAKSVDGGADIRMFDKNGKTTLLAETKDDGSTDIKMFDHQGNTKFYEGLKPDGSVVNTTKLTEEEHAILARLVKARKAAPDVKSETPPVAGKP